MDTHIDVPNANVGIRQRCVYCNGVRAYEKTFDNFYSFC